MSSRHTILNRLREQHLPPVEQPSLDIERQSFEDPLARFEEVLQTVGGTLQRVADKAAAVEFLDSHLSTLKAQKIVSTVPGMTGESLASQVDLESVATPHELHDVDLAILRGSFAVAENAAIWLDLASVKHRVICVLAQHLVVLVPSDEIVATMHEAYARIATAHQDAELPGFGLFLSGPSKTADIEQSLVIGAHGARSLTVLLLQGEE